MENKQEALKLIRAALEDWFGPAHARLAYKWHGGVLKFIPENRTLQEKEIDTETFFHKIVRVRESIRVLEQRINNHPKLDDQDRVQLQQYITRVYGSLTTFNFLFADEQDKFIGQKM